jgi:hypothetical protein
MSASDMAPMADASSPQLRWAPPALEDPVTVRLGTGFTASRLDPRRDYRIVLPEQKKIGGTVLEGGRNIVIVGGHVSADPNTTSDFERRGIYIKNAVGTVHIEGVEIDGAGLPFDGIAINAPEATVQIQNVRVTDLNGSYDGFHADVIQPWGGVRDLRIDRVTGSSNYQGLFLQPDLGPIGSATIQNVDLTHTGPATSRGAYMVWLANESCTSYPISLSEVYVGSDVAWDLNRMVYPSATAGPAECAAQVSGGSTSWPRLPITGSVVQGSPAGGSFVPAGVAGTGYVSPGYGTAGTGGTTTGETTVGGKASISGTTTGTYPAKFQVRRAQAESGHLDMLVDTTARANGDEVEVTFEARGHRETFTETIEDGHLRFKHELPRNQRAARSGIIEIDYKGNERVRPAEVRLRAARGKARLQRELLSLKDGRLSAAGSLNERADGVVRLRLTYEGPDGTVGVWNGRADIESDGAWNVVEEVPAEAHGGGYLSIEFTGYHRRQIRGERIAKQLLAGQVFGTATR